MKTIRIALLGLFAVFSAAAQNRANFPWWNSPVVGDLGLTPAQSQKIRQIVRSYRDRLLDARTNVQKAEGALEDMINDPDVDPDTAKPVIERVSSARANSTRVFLEMSVQMRAVLTLDQWRLLVRHWDQVQRRRATDTQLPPEKSGPLTPAARDQQRHNASFPAILRALKRRISGLVSRVDVGATLQQSLGDLRIPPPGRHVERAALFAIASCIHLRSCSNQCADNVSAACHAAFVRYAVQRSVSARCLYIGVGAKSKQQLDHPQVSLRRRLMQKGPPIPAMDMSQCWICQ